MWGPPCTKACNYRIAWARCQESIAKFAQNLLRNSSRIHSRHCAVPHPWYWSVQHNWKTKVWNTCIHLRIFCFVFTCCKSKIVAFCLSLKWYLVWCHFRRYRQALINSPIDISDIKFAMYLHHEMIVFHRVSSNWALDRLNISCFRTHVSFHINVYRAYNFKIISCLYIPIPKCLTYIISPIHIMLNKWYKTCFDTCSCP